VRVVSLNTSKLQKVINLNEIFIWFKKIVPYVKVIDDAIKSSEIRAKPKPNKRQQIKPKKRQNDN
jgi:hypothetical protein